MSDEKQLKLLKNGVDQWNEWRKENPSVEVDLREADLSHVWFEGANLSRANLSGANLSRASAEGADLHGANLSGANLSDARLFKTFLHRANFSRANLSRALLHRANLSCANLSEANLCGVDLVFANLTEANLSGANLDRADLGGAYLRETNLSRANLTQAVLMHSTMVHTNLDGTILKNCRIYGISTWDLQGTPASESAGLIITPRTHPDVTVDDLEVAQFVYLLLSNDKIRNVIDTIGQKGVLILGRFTPERKEVLDAIREELRLHDYVPMMFDFDKPTDRDFTETIMTLAGMSRFIIADITNPRASPLELQATMPNFMVPFVPIIQKGEKPFSMFSDLYGKYHWVLDPLVYDTAENLVEKLEKGVIKRALEKHKELVLIKAEEYQTVDLEDL